jgi:hypothetical protein
MLRRLRTKLITLSTYAKISSFGNALSAIVTIGARRLSSHPQSPRRMAQQQAIRPARPTPPRQCTRIGMPLRVYWLIRLVKCTSRYAGVSGAKPSGIGRLKKLIENRLPHGEKILTEEHQGLCEKHIAHTQTTERPNIQVHCRLSNCSPMRMRKT